MNRRSGCRTRPQRYLIQPYAVLVLGSPSVCSPAKHSDLLTRPPHRGAQGSATRKMAALPFTQAPLRCAIPCQCRARAIWLPSRDQCPLQAASAPSARSRCLSSAGRASRLVQWHAWRPDQPPPKKIYSLSGLPSTTAGIFRLCLLHAHMLPARTSACCWNMTIYPRRSSEVPAANPGARLS